MPRFKSSHNIFVDHKEIFDPNMLDARHLAFPPNRRWSDKRPMRFEDVDIWEVILEHGGPFGVYAAWEPYGEMYLVVDRGQVIGEFSGVNANARLESFLKKNNIWYPNTSELIVT